MPPKKCPNFPGNCPEYLAWGMVSKNEGDYYSLCLSLIKEQTYRYCGYCEAMASVAASNKKVFINDMWNNSTLIKSSESVDDTAPYLGCLLKEIQVIIGERRGRKVRR
jgi:hypothetical protein